ncbi:MAG: dihydroorotase [Lentisphaeria bacterium]|jgi:dihydroorotase
MPETPPAQVTELTLTAPDDWHIHLRDGASLAYTVPHAAREFARAIIMPNLVPPVTNAAEALAYKARIVDQIPSECTFDPLMVLYLTDLSDAATITQAHAAGVVACKLYPAGATTNSDSGVTSIEKIYGALEAMQKHNMPLLIHGEVTDAAIDIFDREATFIARTLIPLIARFPALKVVLEHITTQEAVDFVSGAGPAVAATITAHHLLYNRNHMLAGGIRPHLYCLPILKRGKHQSALISAATSGNPKFFLGTDSAPHARSKKEAACGCAGSYTAFAALAFYAQVFEQADALDKLEAFASFYGPDFYQLERNTSQVTLQRKAWQVPTSFDFGDDVIVPVHAGEALQWSVRHP